ncbi:MAG: response regulator [Rhodoferax sp.]|nr:MAG: response regulator [Rhodoferax sp.]
MPSFPGRRPFLSWHSLQTRLTILSLGVVVCVLVALDVLVQQRLTTDLEQVLGRQQSATVDLQAKAIEHSLREGIQALNEASNVLAPLQGRSTQALQAALEANPILPHLFNGGAFITDAQGLAVASYPRSAQRVGLNYRDRNHVVHALQTGQPKVGKPVIGKALGTPTVSIAVPLRQPHGGISGTLVGVVDLARANFTSPILSTPYGATGSYLLVSNEWRMVIAGTDAKQALRALPAPGVAPAFDHFVQGGTGQVRLDSFEGLPSLASGAQIPSADWTLMALLPQAEAFAPIHNLMRALLAATVALALLALVLNIWLVRHQLAPAHRASLALARQRESGLEAAPLPVGGQDEIGLLIAGFNALLEVQHERDATLRASEQALQTTTRQLEEAQRLAGLGHWNLDLRTNALHWSPEIFRIFEIDPARFAASYEGFLNAIHPDDRELVDQAYARSLEHRVPYEIEHRLSMADGRVKWVHERGVSEFDADGTPLRTQGTVQDISEKKRVEEQLRHSVELLNNLINTVPVRIFWKDHELNYLGCTTLFAHDAGLQSPQDIVGKSDYQLGWAPLAELFRADDRSVIESGVAKPFYEEQVQVGADQRIWARTAKVPLRNAQGTIQGVLGVYYDITEQKTLAQELQHYRDHLEEQVRQRTAELQAARDQADQANRAKSSFLANMSHEIRTPMNGVIGMVDVLRHTPLDATQQRMLDTVQQSSLVLLAILNDILDFSKIEAGKLSLEMLPTNPRELLAGSVATLQKLADAKQVQIQVHVAPEVPACVLSDPTRLQQILFNLLSNAIKFAAASNPIANIALTASPPGAPQAHWQLQVRDNGIGMDAQVLERLFQPFTQADASIRRHYGGTGLGLSITHRLVHLLGGSIAVESATGHGSCFTVRLPMQPCSPSQQSAAAAAATVPASAQSAPGSAPSVQAAHQAGRLILVAEDNEVNREVICQQLGLLGYACEAAVDGQMAWDMLQQDKYALLLTDCHMPRMDGFALTQAIRQSEQGSPRHLPIIAVTANALQGEAERCLAQGMDGYLSKPLRLPELSAMLQRWLPGGLAATPPEPPAAAPALPVFDNQALSRLIGPNPAMHRRLLGKFLDNLQTQHGATLAALQAQDLPAVRAAAHALKSSAQSVGAMQLGQLCAELEKAARDGDASACTQRAQVFDTLVQHTRGTIGAHTETA